MSDVEVIAKKLVPKGYKTCPACGQLVKGPRTLACPHAGCGHEFAKPAKRGGLVKANPNINKVREKPKTLDPYTFNEYVLPTISMVNGSNQIRVVTGLSNRPKGLASTLAYLGKVTVPDAVDVPSFITNA